MKKVFITFLFCCIAVIGFSQKFRSRQVRPHMLKLDLLTPGLEYEKALGKSSTLNIRGGLGFAFSYFYPTEEDNTKSYVLRPIIDVQFRQYIDVISRRALGKSTKGNSAGFIALKVHVAGAPLTKNFDYEAPISYTAGPMFGMQRTYRSNINLQMGLGVGYFRDELGQKGITPLGNIILGFALGRM